MEELDLKELFNMFWSKKLIIILIVAIFMVIGGVYSYIFVEPDYAAETTVVLAQSANKTTNLNGEIETTITTNDLTLNQKLVSTYSELIKSQNVLGDVIENLKLDKSVNGLKRSITVSTVKDTDLISIRVTDEDPKLAAKIASEIADVFIDKVANGVYKIDNVQVWDKAEVPKGPYNINHVKDIIIFAFIGLVISAVYVIVANMLDTTIKSKEDIEEKLGLSLLTAIPVCNFESSLTKSKKGGNK